MLNTDITPLIRKHSPTLPDRGYVHVANNKVSGNRPVDIGYDISTVGLSVRKALYNCATAPWNLPLSMRRIPSDANRGTFTAEQLNDLLNNEALPFNKKLIVNALDSQYGTPEYIVDVADQFNLVSLIRMKNNRVVYDQLTLEEQEARRLANKDNRGTTAIYGEKHKLNELFEETVPADSCQEFSICLTSGRKCLVEVRIWENEMIRSKRGKSMKDKPFRLVNIKLKDPQTGEAIFKKQLWLAVCGKRRMELTGEEIFWSYRQRFDIEHFFRFGKQRLLLDKFQTPDIEHLDNWMEIVSLSYWLLWVSRKEADVKTLKWRKYDKRFQQRQAADLDPSPSEVQRQLSEIFLGFSETPFLPNSTKKGKGRQQGDKQPLRAKYKVVKKGKKKKKTSKKCE